MTGLMICNRIRLPYRVMRCMAAAGVQVHVLGNPMSRGLRYSRSCRSFGLANSKFDGGFDDEMAEEVNEACRRLKVDIVFPGCALSSRSFLGIKDRLAAKSFPGPDLGQFDLLNNKWEFVRLCWELGIPVPDTKLFDNKDEVLAGLREGQFQLPVICKPLCMDGERGVQKLSHETLEQRLAGVDYSPLLIQEFIEGDDIGASAFCIRGEIVSYLAHHLYKGNYTTFSNSVVYDSIEKIASKFKLDGVYNFDMRRNANGEIFFLECNPRFFFKMPFSLAAGINFALPGVSPAFASQQATCLDETLTRTPRAWPKLFLKPWTMNTRDKVLAKHLLSDPLSFARELVHLDWD